ncbi:hypothetical protein TEA_013115 [Camellia sinensis var. sinensis]|uniref:FG-GAP repeat-containing protein n=1 Tax=Camellia sinensis var. sinensis TaxID=542762 RepID=A0A4S4DC79_CAMSN|nr:hypothetical protein TEA_013115 [Camellia sinensis var. sinensis]
MASSSSSELTFKLYPLVILNISDHYTCLKFQSQPPRWRRSNHFASSADGLLFANISRDPKIEVKNMSSSEAWFHLSEEYPIKFEAERLPPPIVADLNGDGKKEIFVATHDAKIQRLGHAGESFFYAVGLLNWRRRRWMRLGAGVYRLWKGASLDPGTLQFMGRLSGGCHSVAIWVRGEEEGGSSMQIVVTEGKQRAQLFFSMSAFGNGVLEAHDRRVDEGFSEARVLVEVTLLPDKIRVASGRRAVAMATGVVDRFYKPGQVQKQVLVVVTSGWSVMCFDHNLKKLWETNLQEDFPHNAHHREIAISITNYTLKHGDAGLVIVGGRMEMQPHMFVDPFEEIGMAEKNAEQHRRSANEKEASENSGTVDIRHFAFYAFAGRTGTLRWNRKNEVTILTQNRDSAFPKKKLVRIVFLWIEKRDSVQDGIVKGERERERQKPGRATLTFALALALILDVDLCSSPSLRVRLLCLHQSKNVEAHSSDASQLIPQHNYKLDAHALNSRHPGEFECREFRESILGVMPHQWDRREDTLLKLAHFRRHKRKTLKKTSGKTTNYPFHKPEENHPPGKDSTKKISNLIGKAAKYAGSAKSKKPMTYIPTITNYTQLWWVPNVVVAHQKEGIEAVHLASGRTICKLHLQEGGLHADINGDGVLDHVQVVGGNGAEQTVVSGSMEVLRPCWAVATSGVPVREQLFNASICHYSHFNFFQHGDFSRSFGHNLDVSSLEVATPILLPRSDGHRHRKGSHGDVIFLTNRGEVTSYAPGLHGHDAVWQWQLVTGATWSNLPSPSGMMEAGMVVPTLKAFSLRVHDNQELILAAGDQEAVVLSPGGSILTSVVLPAPPTHALICDDFSNDGLTDLILVTSSGVYGFVQTRHPAVYRCISDMKIIISLKKYSHCLKSREIVVGNASKLGNYTSSRVFIGMMN